MLHALPRCLCVLVLITLASGCKLFETEKKTRVGDIYVTVNAIGNNFAGVAADVSVYTRPTTKTGVTDNYGSVLLKEIPVGSYEVFASLAGFGSGKQVVKVEENQLTNVNITLQYGKKDGLAPEIKLVLPVNNSSFSPDEEITFSADVTDNDSPSQSLEVKWESDIDGVIHTSSPSAGGNISFKKKLSKGKHTIKVTATDPDKYTSSLTFSVSTTAPKPVTLTSAKKDANGNIVLTWTRYSDTDFRAYEVYSAPLSNSSEKTLLYTTTNSNTLTYTDSNVGFADKVYYYVRVVTNMDDGRNSNEIEVIKPSGDTWEKNVFDAVMHPTENKIYLLDRDARKMSVLDFTTREELLSINVNGTPGRFDIGDNGMGLELYVPCSDGWIYCYDAKTLTQNKSINAGLPLTSVVSSNKGYLVAAMSNQWTRPLAAFNRKTGMEIAGNELLNGSLYGGAILRAIPNSNNVMAISSQISPIDMDFLEFNAGGSLVRSYDDKWHGDYPLNPHIFKASRSGEYVITGAEGAVYSANSSMQYRGQVQRGGLFFSDFAFSSDSKRIYAGTSNRKSVQVIEYPDLSRKEEILLKGYPLFVFTRDEALIVICREKEESGRIGLQTISLK